MVAKFDRRSALLVSELTGFVAKRAMKTAGRENPIHGVTLPRNREHGAAGQDESRSIKWAEKQKKLQPGEMCFFLDSSLYRTNRGLEFDSHAPPTHSVHNALLGRKLLA
jgi:hypothetical protein